MSSPSAKSVSRFEDPRLIRGGGRYTDDIKLPGMVHAVVLRSPYAHAKIKSIDSTAAEGRARRIGSADRGRRERSRLRRSRRCPVISSARDGSPMYKPRYPILAEDRVRWVGDYIAFVVS